MTHFVAIPTVSSLHISPHPRLLERLDRWKIHPVYIDNFMPQWRARNEIVRRFLASGARYLTMIDCDTVPRKLSVVDFPDHNDLIVAGHYALYSDVGMFQFSVGKLMDANPVKSLYAFSPVIPRGWSEWDVCGFGCVTIPRTIIENLLKWGDGENVFHPTMNGVTEDVPVCELARAEGVKIVTHDLLICEHWRTVDITEQLEIQNRLVEELKL